MKLTEEQQTPEEGMEPIDSQAEPNYNVRTLERGLVARAAFVAVLALTLVGALRWAMNVTNANARQISANLRRMQAQMDADRGQTRPDPSPTATDPTKPFVGENGPVISPAPGKP